MENVFKIFDYRSNEDYTELVKITRSNTKRLEKMELRLVLSDGLVIKTTPQRCLLNMLIFRVLDYWEIFDNRKEYIFTGSYLKGKPVKYMRKCLSLIEKDSKFSKLPDDDYVIRLPHMLAELKEQFYLMSTIVDGVLMLDHSLYDYITAYRTNEDFKKIVDGPIINANDPPWVVAEKLEKLIHKFEKEIDIKPLSDFYKSGVKVNRSQLMMFFCWGLVPNYLSMGKMLDYPVTGGVLNGYSTRKDIHLNDNVSILALWTQKSEIKTPGRVSKEFAVALGSAKLNKSDTRETLDDCHSERTAKIKIENEDDLAFYRFKYYKGKDGKFTKFIDRDSTELIGRTLEIRSIVMCDGDGVICKKCYGANWRFAVDTSLYKGNINDYTLVLVAQILQGVISIKHYLGGILMKMIVTWLEKEMEMQEFIKLDIVNDIDYNILEFNSTCKCDLMKENIGDEFETLYIDGVKLGYDNEIVALGNNRFKFTVPNDSVMRKAENLLTALNNHRKEDYFTKESDFNINDFLHLSIEDQLMEILNYLRSRIKLDHFIHYELMVYGMTRDLDNKSQRVTKDTKRILFMHSNDILLYPDRNHSMASTLPYGYISKALSTVYKDNKPDEYDLLYANLLNKEPNNDTAYREMNSVLAGAINRNDEYFGYEDGLTNNATEGEE